jgi:hypothetical protein
MVKIQGGLVSRWIAFFSSCTREEKGDSFFFHLFNFVKRETVYFILYLRNEIPWFSFCCCTHNKHMGTHNIKYAVAVFFLFLSYGDS